MAIAVSAGASSGEDIPGTATVTRAATPWRIARAHPALVFGTVIRTRATTSRATVATPISDQCATPRQRGESKPNPKLGLDDKVEARTH